MSYTLKLPFQAFELSMHGGSHITLPLNDMHHAQINVNLQTIAKKYQEQFQNTILNNGDAVDILEEQPFSKFEKKTVKVDYPASSDGFTYPEFSLDFTIYYSEETKGLLGYIPAIAMQFFSPSEDEIEALARQTIQLEFSKSKRLRNLHSIISTIWFDSIQFIEQQIELKFLRPSEIESLDQSPSKGMLPNIGRQLLIKEKASFFREEEVQQIANILNGKYLKNVLIVGPSGVGKTALVQELAFHAKKLKVKERILETTASILIKELTGETGWQDAITTFAEQLQAANEILYVRNLHELFEVGQYEGNNISVAEFIKPFLSRGELILISECTKDELNNIELKHSNFSSLFHVIELKPPKNLETAISKKIEQTARKKHIHISERAIKECVRIFKRFNPYSGFPGKPIRFLEGLVSNSSEGAKESLHIIEKGAIIKHFCQETGMPEFIIDQKTKMHPDEVHSFFNQRIFGQKRAVNQVVNVISTIKTALNRPDKPISSFLFVGPTGVGKTEMAKSLAKFMFDDEEKMIRFDMSEYADIYGVSRLIGIGAKQDGTLHQAVRRNPFGVLLFDEIEKAHPDFFDLLLQILSEGRLTDKKGKVVNFCSLIIIMTSNIGASKFQQEQIGWNSGVSNRHLADQYKSEVEKHFRPELFNRIDQIIPFAPLTRASMIYIVNREVDLLLQREGIKFRNVELSISTGAKTLLAEKGYDKKFGARYLQKSLQEKLILPLAETLNEYDYEQALRIKIGVKSGDLKISTSRIDENDEDYIELLERLILTDLVSDLRRKIHQLQEGQAYISLINQSNQFNTNDNIVSSGSPNKHELQKLKIELSKLIGEIETIEENLSLYSLNHIPYNRNWEFELENWKTRFSRFQRNLYLKTYPDEEKGIYFYLLGTDEASHFIELYVNLFEMNHFNYEIHSMWHEKAFFDQAMSANAYPYYLQFEKELPNKAPKPKTESHRYCGIRFTIHTSLARLFLKDEIGIHHWTPKPDEIYKTSLEIFPIEDQIIHLNCHKKDFLKGDKPRRLIGPDFLKDQKLTGTSLPIKISSSDQINLIQNALEEAFEEKLEAALA